MVVLMDNRSRLDERELISNRIKWVIIHVTDPGLDCCQGIKKPNNRGLR
jgi:hypothetical protein